MARCGNFETEIEIIEFEIWNNFEYQDESNLAVDKDNTSNLPTPSECITSSKKCKNIETCELSKYKVSFIFSNETLKQRLRKKFEEYGYVLITLNCTTATLVIALGPNVNYTVDVFAEEVITELSELESELKHISEGFEEDRYDIALEKVDEFVDRRKGVKVYRQPECFRIVHVCVDEKERQSIQTLIDILKKQLVISTNVFIGENSKEVDMETIKLKLAPLSVVINCYDNIITIKGFEDDVRESVAYVRHILRDGKGWLKSFAIDDGRYLLMQKQTVECLLNEMLKSKQLEPLWWKVIDGKLYVEGSDDEIVLKAACAIADIFKCLSFEPINRKVVQSKLWMDYKKELSQSFGDQIMIDDIKLPTIHFTVTENIFTKVEESLNKFKGSFKSLTIEHSFETNLLQTILKEEMEAKVMDECLESINKPTDKVLVVSGTAKSIETVRTRFQCITSCLYGVQNPEATDYIKRNSMQMNAQRQQYQLEMIENKTVLVLKMGKIEEEQADVIVNSASPDLKIGNANPSSITYWISKASGPEAQRWLDEHFKAPVNSGTVLEGNAGELKCRKLFHVVLPKYASSSHDNCMQKLEHTVETCLMMANSNGFTSIAFPAICTGVLNYPRNHVAEHLIDKVVEFINTNKNKPLKEIRVVLLPVDKLSQKAFADVEERRKKDLDTAADDTDTALLASPTWPCKHYCRVIVSSNDKHQMAFDSINDMVQRAVFPKDSVGGIGQ